MLCARECPDWCIYIDSHKEEVPPTTPGGRARQRNVLDRFAIDFSLCMYCGICIEVCPFDALHWSPEFEYAELDIRDLLHEKDRLGAWMATVPPPPALDPGSAEPAEVTAAARPARQPAERVVRCAGAAARPTRVRKESTPAPPAADPTRGMPKVEQTSPSCPPTAPRRSRLRNRLRPGGFDAGAADGVHRRRGPRVTTRDIVFVAVGAITALSALLSVTTKHVVHAALWLLVSLGSLAGCYLVLGQELVGLVQLLVYVGAIVVLVLFALMLTRAPIGPHAEIDTPALAARRRRGARGARRPRCSRRCCCRSSPARRSTSTGRPTRHAAVAQAVFGTWVWPFELLSVLLLVALIGAFAVSRLVLRDGTAWPSRRPASATARRRRAPRRARRGAPVIHLRSRPPSPPCSPASASTACSPGATPSSSSSASSSSSTPPTSCSSRRAAARGRRSRQGRS